MVMKNFIKAIKWVDPYKLKKTWIIKIFVVAFSLDIFAFSVTGNGLLKNITHMNSSWDFWALTNGGTNGHIDIWSFRTQNIKPATE